MLVLVLVLRAVLLQPANHKWLLLILWLAKMGVGLVPSKDIIMAARRLRIT